MREQPIFNIQYSIFNLRRLLIASVMIWGTLCLCLTGCEKETQPPLKVVGIVNVTPTLEDAVSALKTGLAQSGYKEGKNIRYVYEGPLGSMDKVDAAVQKILKETPDLIVSFTTPVTLKVKKATNGTDIPVLFAPSGNPVGSGLVKSLKEPGGRLTGICVGNSGIKALVWLNKMVPELKRLYVPFNPNDRAMKLNMKVLKKAAADRNIELIIGTFNSQKEMPDVLNHIPPEVQAVWQLASPFWGAHMDAFVTSCLKQKKPLKTHVVNWVRAGALMSYGLNGEAMGHQMSLLAGHILKGTSPAVLPVEQAEYFLVVNLKTANEIGLTIPDAVLKQADQVIR